MVFTKKKIKYLTIHNKLLKWLCYREGFDFSKQDFRIVRTKRGNGLCCLTVVQIQNVGGRALWNMWCLLRLQLRELSLCSLWGKLTRPRSVCMRGFASEIESSVRCNFESDLLVYIGRQSSILANHVWCDEHPRLTVSPLPLFSSILPVSSLVIALRVWLRCYALLLSLESCCCYGLFKHCQYLVDGLQLSSRKYEYFKKIYN